MIDFKHISIMPDECIDGLNIKENGIYVDATTGGGGHSILIAQRLKGGRLFCFDRDDDALKAAGERLKDFDCITYVKSNFSHMLDEMKARGVEGVDGILFDLGVSSYQLDNGERGFSYMTDAPLDMRMDKCQAFSARDVINNYSQNELMKIFYDYGEEKFSRRIAENIVKARENKAIETTLELVDIIKASMPQSAKREKQHPAKRVFQAVRIEVNQELASVEQAVKFGIELLNPGGRIAVMSFHSLEDRIIKTEFNKQARGCICPKSFPICICANLPTVQVITKKAVTAREGEVLENPRARSAKLRIAEKI